MCHVEAKGSTNDPDSNNIYGSNSKVTITKSNKTYLAPEYIYTTAKICNSWHMFNCKKLFKLQIRPPRLILLFTTSQDRWIFPSQSWKVRNSIIIIIVTPSLEKIIVKSVSRHLSFNAATHFARIISRFASACKLFKWFAETLGCRERSFCIVQWFTQLAYITDRKRKF